MADLVQGNGWSGSAWIYTAGEGREKAIDGRVTTKRDIEALRAQTQAPGGGPLEKGKGRRSD